MKKILATILVAFCPIITANEYPHNYTIIDNTQVLYVESEWELIYNIDAYKFYIRKDTKQIDKGVYAIHTLLEYNLVNGVTYESLKVPVKRVFTHGVIECEYNVFNLLTDIYTDKNNIILYSAEHEVGEYKSELKTKNTARNTVYNKVCIDSI